MRLRNLGRWESKSQRPKLKRRILFCQVLEIGSETRPAVLYSHYLRDVVAAIACVARATLAARMLTIFFAVTVVSPCLAKVLGLLGVTGLRGLAPRVEGSGMGFGLSLEHSDLSDSPVAQGDAGCCQDGQSSCQRGQDRRSVAVVGA